VHARDVKFLERDHPSVALGAGMPNQTMELWLAGALAGQGWLGLGLVLADGTVLHNGDCLKLRCVDQHAISAGFEWECHDLMLERFTQWSAAQHHASQSDRDVRKVLSVDPTRQMPVGEAEGLPSKAIAYRSAVPGMMVAAEVSPELDVYGEFVLGVAYDCAALTNQAREIVRMARHLMENKSIVTRSPEQVMNRNHPLVQWCPIGERFVVRTTSRAVGIGTGTPQGSFGVPLWMLPSLLRILDKGEESLAAINAGEDLAEADHLADDMVLGLVIACEYYIQCLVDSPPSADDDGPKAQVPVMLRTDFCAMFGLLDIGQQARFAAWATNHAWRGRPVPGWPQYPQAAAYLVEANPCTIGRWLDTIQAPLVDGKDALSPPAPYWRHDTGQLIPYAMGKMELDGTTNHVIAEWRAMGLKWGNCGYEKAITFITKWAALILLAGDGVGPTAVPPANDAGPYQPYV
jgi:hypothetical protein